MTQIVVEDTLVSYKQTGQGPLLLCVHGWNHSISSYDQLTEVLQGRYELLVLDLPNFGNSQSNDKIITIDDYARFLAAFVKKLNIQKYTAIGHSMGGQILIRATGTGVLKPEKLVLIAAAGVRDQHKQAKAVLRIASKIVSKFTPSGFKKRFYKLIGSDYDQNLSPVLKKVIDSVLQTDVVADAGRVAVPTLLVYGTADKQTPPAIGERFHAAIKGSELNMLDGADHWLHQNRTKEVAKCVEDFLGAQA